MELLIAIIISGLAVAYFVEFLTSLLENWIDGKILRAVFTLPANVAGLYLLGYWDNTLFVSAPAASLVSAIISILINRPTVIRR